MPFDVDNNVEMGEVVGEAVAVTGGDSEEKEDSPTEPKFIDDADAKSLLDKIVAAYVAWFVLLRLVDVYYYFTVDGRFPEDLRSYDLYPSDEDRLETVRFTQWRLLITMVGQTVNFCAVMALVRTKAVASLDESLRPILARADHVCCGWAHIPCDSCAQNACGCCPCRPKWGRLSRGAAFLTVWGLAFQILAVPFQLWQYKLMADYGFTNTLNVPLATQVSTALWSLAQSPLAYFNFLFMLMFLGIGRNVLIVGWTILQTVQLFVQFNPSILAAAMGGRAFPSHDFGVSHGFAPVEAASGAGLLPLNRIYYPEELRTEYGLHHFYQTHDRSRGDYLVLAEHRGRWTINRGAGLTDPTLAQSQQVNRTTVQMLNPDCFPLCDSYQPLPENVDELQWQTPDAAAFPDDAYVSVRHGKEMRERLMAFATAHDIAIEEIYMIDGSSQSTAANAFAAGLGGGKIIALYDTLFLGDNISRSDSAVPDSVVPDPSSPSSWRPQTPPDLLQAASAGLLKTLGDHEGQVPMLALLEQAEGVDDSDGAGAASSEPARRGRGFRSMKSGEIIGILGHELGHSALGHNFRGVFVNAFTTAVSFGAMGFCLYDPKLTLAMGAASSSTLHVGYLLYTHVVGSLVSGCMGQLTNSITRSQEYAADAYSAEVSEEYATDLQTGLAKLTVNMNVDPDEPWLYEFLHRDHPTMAHRWSAIQSIKDRRYGSASTAGDVDNGPAVVTPAPDAEQMVNATPTSDAEQVVTV